MARTPTAFSDDQLQAILLVLPQLAVRYRDNRQFLRALVDEVERITERTYGQKIYRRLLAVAGISRKPSTATFQSVLNARRKGGEGERELRDDRLRAFVKAIYRETNELGPPAPQRSPSSRDSRDDCSETWLAQHCTRLETENLELRDQLYQARSKADVANANAESTTALLAKVEAGASARERELVESLAGVPGEFQALAERLEGAERRRLLETDAMRRAMREERADFVAKIKTLEKDLQTAKEALEAYRRAAGGIAQGRPR